MYTPPLRLYLVVSISFFVIVAWLASSGILLEPGQDPTFDAAVQAQFLSDDLPRLMFVLLPVFALLLKGVYRSHLYFNHLIFAIHLHTIGYIVLALMLPIEDIASQYVGLAIAQAVLLAYFLADCGVEVAGRPVRLHDRRLDRDREYEHAPHHRGLALITRTAKQVTLYCSMSPIGDGYVLVAARGL